MVRPILIMLVLSGSLAGPLAAIAGYPPPTPGDISLFVEDGGYVVRNDAGYALYTYDRDPTGKSTCWDECAAAWPPLLASQNAHPLGPWTLIPRDPTTRQWVYKGKPVYTFANDTLGKAEGDGVDGVWKLIRLR